MVKGQCAALTTNVKGTDGRQIRAFPHPLVTGDFPGCDYCSWVWRPGLSLEGKTWVLKFPNRVCFRHNKLCTAPGE